MSCRTSRSRSAKVVLEEGAEQTRKITHVFKVTRGRGRTQKKLLSSTDIGEEKPIIDSILSGECSTKVECLSSVSESVCSPPKRAKKCIEQRDVGSARKALFINETTLDVGGELKTEANPKEEAKPVSSSTEPANDCLTPVKEVASVKTESLPSDGNSCTDATTPSLNPLLSTADKLLEKLKSSAVHSKTRTRIRNVAELQAMLAEKESIKIIHEQAQRNKSKQVEEDANALKHPLKYVPVGHAVTKTYTKGKTRVVKECLPKQTEPNIPDFVLPTHQTPAKQSVDELELDEKRHAFDYGKASRLVNEVKNNSTLPLPRNYERLHGSFQSCDRVLSIFMSQGRRCVVSEIQKNVEKNTKLTFSRKQLAQIVHVYPTSYDIKVEKQWNPFGGESKSRGKFELVMAANLINDLADYMLPDIPSKVDDQPLPKVTPVKLLSPRKKVVTAMPRDPVIDIRPRLEGWRMTCRSHVFKHKLAEIVKNFHQKFLERVGLRLNDCEITRLRRFHPKFDLDQECDEIEEAELPHVPSDADEPHLQMKDYLATVDTSAPLPKAVNTAIQDLKSPLKKLVSSCSDTPLSPRKFAEQQALKPKGAASLLERIRAKEAAKKLADSLRDPVIEKKIGVLQRILHGLLRCITTYFAFKKVRSMDVNTLSEQIMRSQSALNRALILEHISTLCEVVPDYFTTVEIGGRMYLQLKENNYTAIEKLLQEEVTRLRGISSSRLSTTNITSTCGNVEMSSTKKSAVRALF